MEISIAQNPLQHLQTFLLKLGLGNIMPKWEVFLFQHMNILKQIIKLSFKMVSRFSYESNFPPHFLCYSPKLCGYGATTANWVYHLIEAVRWDTMGCNSNGDRVSMSSPIKDGSSRRSAVVSCVREGGYGSHKKKCSMVGSCLGRCSCGVKAAGFCLPILPTRMAGWLLCSVWVPPS